MIDCKKDVLKLIAEESTTQEIADKLFLGKHTIESYRKNLISKLQVKNLASLTKQAIKRGLLDSSANPTSNSTFTLKTKRSHLQIRAWSNIAP